MMESVIKDATAKIMAATAKATHTPEQECLIKAERRIHTAKRIFGEQYRLRLIPPTFDEAVEMIYPILRQQFADWSKDDLATLACMTLSITAADSLRDHLI